MKKGRNQKFNLWHVDFEISFRDSNGSINLEVRAQCHQCVA
jgi:hypothetical protein